jgi:phage-related protein
VKTRASPEAIVGDVQRDQTIGAKRQESLVRPATEERTALQRFVDAVVAFSNDPTPANLERYLSASRSLEESRRSELAKTA